ncbi:MAG: hypothetical protein WAM60_05550 [Candidatus Promineifilaceae bacterium]
MQDPIRAILVFIVSGATTAVLLSLMVILLPKLSSLTARTIETMPGRSFILGAINFIFFSAVAVVLSRIGQGIGSFFGGLFSLMALAISLVLLLLLTIGLSGLVRLISERINESKPLSTGHLLRAAVLLVGAAFAPLAGWFVLTPVALFIGLGAAIISLIQWISGRISSRPSD